MMVKGSGSSYRLLGIYKPEKFKKRFVWMEKPSKDIILFEDGADDPLGRYILSDFRKGLRLGDYPNFTPTQIGRAILGV